MEVVCRNAFPSFLVGESVPPRVSERFLLWCLVPVLTSVICQAFGELEENNVVSQLFLAVPGHVDSADDVSSQIRCLLWVFLYISCRLLVLGSWFSSA